MHKTDKNIEKMSSTQQPTLLNIVCFWRYFVPMSTDVNLTSFFKSSCHFNENEEHNLS